MTQWLVYAASGLTVFSLGLVGLFVHHDVVRRILASNIAASGAFLVLIALARRSTAGPPDPVPHALVLTGVVVSVSATALALALLRRLPTAGEASDAQDDS